MIRKFKENFRLTIKANNASPTPPIGPMLGQRGINIIEFSKDFNNKTKEFKDSIPIPIDIIVQRNKSVSIKLQKPINTYFLKKCLNIEKGSNQPKHSIISNIKLTTIYEIININYPNLSENLKIKKCKSLISTAKSIGIIVN